MCPKLAGALDKMEADMKPGALILEGTAAKLSTALVVEHTNLQKIIDKRESEICTYVTET